VALVGAEIHVVDIGRDAGRVLAVPERAVENELGRFGERLLQSGDRAGEAVGGEREAGGKTSQRDCELHGESPPGRKRQGSLDRENSGAGDFGVGPRPVGPPAYPHAGANTESNTAYLAVFRSTRQA